MKLKNHNILKNMVVSFFKKILLQLRYFVYCMNMDIIWITRDWGKGKPHYGHMSQRLSLERMILCYVK